MNKKKKTLDGLDHPKFEFTDLFFEKKEEKNTKSLFH